MALPGSHNYSRSSDDLIDGKTLQILIAVFNAVKAHQSLNVKKRDLVPTYKHEKENALDAREVPSESVIQKNMLMFPGDA